MGRVFDSDYIYKQMEEHVGTINPEDTVLGQMKESTERYNEENAKSAKKQNLISNWIQVLTLITAVLTLLATVWFGLQGS